MKLADNKILSGDHNPENKVLHHFNNAKVLLVTHLISMEIEYCVNKCVNH